MCKIRNISNKAKNKTSTNLAHINVDNVKVKPYNQSFKRREFQFPTQIYNPKKENDRLKELLKGIRSDKKKEIINKEKEESESESERAGSEDDENDDDDNEFNLDNINNLDKNNDNKNNSFENSDNKDEKEKEKENINVNVNTINSDNNTNRKSDKEDSDKKYKTKPIPIRRFNIRLQYKSKEKEKEKEIQKEKELEKIKEKERERIKENELEKIKEKEKEKIKEKEKEKIKEQQEREKIKVNIIKKEPKEETNQNKSRNIIFENYRKINPEPKREREKYSSVTDTTSRMSKISENNRLKRQIDNPRRYVKYDSINEEYRKKNNLIIENINSKEKIIKNEYLTNNKDKKHLKNYKTEYIWDKIIHRLVEKRIYFDDNETTNNNNKYDSNTFNIVNKYKLDSNKSNEKENNDIKETDKEQNNSDKKENIIDNNEINNNKEKNKILPRLYTDNNTFRYKRNLNENKKETPQKNDFNKSTYRIYQKREIIKKEETKQDKPEKNRTVIIEKTIKTREYPKKIDYFNKKEKLGEKEKEEKQNFKKFPYYQYNKNTNNKKNNIRLNMLSGEDDIFKEDENELKNKPKNNLYNNYTNNKKPKSRITYGKKNKTNNDSDLIEDLGKIEQYSIHTYLKNDLLDIYNTISEEYGDFKNDVFNININNVDDKIGQMDKNKDKDESNSYRKKIKYNVNDLCRGKTTTEDIYKKYTKRAIKIKSKVNF